MKINGEILNELLTSIVSDKIKDSNFTRYDVYKNVVRSVLPNIVAPLVDEPLPSTGYVNQFLDNYDDSIPVKAHTQHIESLDKIKKALKCNKVINPRVIHYNDSYHHILISAVDNISNQDIMGVNATILMIRNNRGSFNSILCTLPTNKDSAGNKLPIFHELAHAVLYDYVREFLNQKEINASKDDIWMFDEIFTDIVSLSLLHNISFLDSALKLKGMRYKKIPLNNALYNIVDSFQQLDEHATPL